MPRTSAAVAAQTAETVLQAATDLFASRGFADVSIDDVAHACAVTRGAVYHHFENKAGLFSAVASRLQAHLADVIVNASDRAGSDPGAQLRAGSHAFLDAITDGPAIRILLIDAPAVIGWKQWRRLDSETSATHLRDALRAVGVDDDLLDATTAQLSGAMNESAMWIAEQSDAFSARTHAHAALDQLLASYLT